MAALKAGKGLIQDLLGFPMVHLSHPHSRGCGGITATVRDLDAADVEQAREHEGPGTHVAGLFLHPHHLPGAVLLEHPMNVVGGERAEALQTHDVDLALQAPLLPLCSQCVEQLA